MTARLPTLDHMLDELIRTPSVSSIDPALDLGNRRVSEILAGWLEDLGFDVELMTVAGDTRKLNVIATLGTGSGGLVLSGHTDTVPFDEDQWTRDPFSAERRDGRLYGLGSTDMKSFFATVLAAVSGFAARDLSQPLIVLGTADEESGMSGAKALVAAGRPRARHALIGEPTRLRPVRMHKGILMERIRLTGRSGHSSDPKRGLNALDGMYRVMAALMSLREELAQRHVCPHFAVPGPTLNLGRIRGGDNPNRICSACELDIDLRPVPGMKTGDARSMLRDRVRDSIDGTGLALQFDVLFDGIEPLETPADADIVQVATRLTGYDASSVAFATEAPFFRELGMQTVVMGPGDIDVAHQPDEYLSLDTVPRTVSLLTDLIRHFCH